MKSNRLILAAALVLLVLVPRLYNCTNSKITSKFSLALHWLALTLHLYRLTCIRFFLGFFFFCSCASLSLLLLQYRCCVLPFFSSILLEMPLTGLCRCWWAVSRRCRGCIIREGSWLGLKRAVYLHWTTEVAKSSSVGVVKPLMTKSSRTIAVHPNKNSYEFRPCLSFCLRLTVLCLEKDQR